MTYSEAQKQALYRYQKKKVQQIKFTLNKETEKDILDRLNSVPHKMTYIKDLIRKDILANPNLYDYLTESKNWYDYLQN